MRHAGLLRALTLALALAAPAFAADPVESDWEVYVPPADPLDPGASPEGGFSAPDRVRFGEKLRQGVLDQLCRNLRVPYRYALEGDFEGTGVGLRRWMGRIPDNQFVGQLPNQISIVDEIRLEVGFRQNFLRDLGDGGPVAGFEARVRLEGTSMIARPLSGAKTCSQVGTLVDLRDIKTVLPVNGKRIGAMAVGELWRIPFELTVSHGEGVSDKTGDATVSIGFLGEEKGRAALTLFRISEDRLRFRMHVDRVEIRTRSGRFSRIIPAVDFPSLGGGILKKLVSREISSQLERYTSLFLQAQTSRSQGKRVLLEYIVDPRDSVQTKAIADALRGDFADLIKMGWHMGAQQATDRSTLLAYEKLRARHDGHLGKPSYAAIDDYRDAASRLTLNIPFLTHQMLNSLEGNNTVTHKMYEDGDEEIRFSRADRTRNSEYFNVVFLGPLIKNDSQRSVQAVTMGPAGEPHGSPFVVYLEQHGYLRNPWSAVDDTLSEFNGVMSLAGASSRGFKPRKSLEIPVPSGKRSDALDHKGWVSFTIAFNQNAVKQLLSATTKDIVTAYVATLDAAGRRRMDWILSQGPLREDGTVDYKLSALHRAFPGSNALARVKTEGEIAMLAQSAARIVSDLAAARNAPDHDARAVALAKAFSGNADSKLAYEDALRVFVQLVDPLDITADFVANVNSSKGRDLKLHYVLKKNRVADGQLRRAGEARARFAAPSILTD